MDKPKHSLLTGSFLVLQTHGTARPTDVTESRSSPGRHQHIVSTRPYIVKSQKIVLIYGSIIIINLNKIITLSAHDFLNFQHFLLDNEVSHGDNDLPELPLVVIPLHLIVQFVFCHSTSHSILPNNQ